MLPTTAERFSSTINMRYLYFPTSYTVVGIRQQQNISKNGNLAYAGSAIGP